MLVLTRKIDEAVVVGTADGIGETVKVTVVSIIGGRVRLGFEVPAELPIHRWEVWQRIRGTRPVTKPIEDIAIPAVRN